MWGGPESANAQLSEADKRDGEDKEQRYHARERFSEPPQFYAGGPCGRKCRGYRRSVSVIEPGYGVHFNGVRSIGPCAAADSGR